MSSFCRHTTSQKSRLCPQTKPPRSGQPLIFALQARKKSGQDLQQLKKRNLSIEPSAEPNEV